MEDQEKQSFSDRVAALEATVENLHTEVNRLLLEFSQRFPDLSDTRRQPAAAQPHFVERKPEVVPPAAPPPQPATSPAVPKIPAPAKKSFELPEHMRKMEYWLNKVGIGLLLFAVVFLFKYSIDQGWLTPPIRIVFGLVLGTALLIISYRIYDKKKHFSQVLMGGAIATYYITGFAAFQLFSLVSYPVALGFMIAVTVLSFFVSLRQDEAIFSLIGTLGGLGTPFLLYTDSGTVTGLVIYTCLILAGTGAVYFYQGWRSLLWLSIIGGWLVFIIGLMGASATFTNHSADQWALEIGIIISWLLFWAVPMFREVVRATNPGRWRPSLLGIGDTSLSAGVGKILDAHVFALAVVVPLVSLGISTLIWPDLADENWGWIILGAAAIVEATHLFLRRLPDLKDLAFAHVLMGLLFFTIALSLLLEGDTLFVALATEAAVLHLVAIRISSKGISISAHILFVICGLWMMNRVHLSEVFQLFKPFEGTPIFNARALTDLWVLALGVMLTLQFKKIVERRFYLIAVFVFSAAWFGRELNGNIEFIIILAEAVLVHFIAMRQKDRVIAALGHVFFAMIGLWLTIRMISPDTGATAILNIRALVNLLPIAASVGMYKLIANNKAIFVYRLLAHVAVLGWFLSEFIPLESGQGYITIAWGIYAALLLIGGLRFNYHRLRLVSIITLFFVVAKLFLIDLANLDVLWRILLFMGFGGLFLFLSYYFQDLWKAKPKETETEA